MTSIPFFNLIWLLAGLALAAAPHIERLPPWISLIALILLGWRTYLGWSGNPLPRKWLLFVFVGACLFGAYLTYRTIFGRDAGVALLVMFLGLKLMEMRNYRDAHVVIFLAYFLALTNFFYSQSIATGGLMILTVLVITASLVSFEAPARRHVDNLKTAGVLLAQAGPVMLLLFFLFPRVQGPLWGLPQDAYSGISGLSDSMSPGSISNLSLSDSVAFRVKFEGAPPPRRQLYWRGPVFWEFDGRTWHAGNVRLSKAYRFETAEPHYDYAVTLEPHNRLWLFALELAANIQPPARVTNDYLMLSLQPVRSRMRYEVRSYPTFKAIDASSGQDLAAALELPTGLNPRALQLAQDWQRESGGDTTAIVNRGLDFFRSQGFGYTLEPPLLLSRHTVDEFLFGAKRGFCEHFAGSFAFLMRAAGVPARVVTGYQGGDLNPVDQFMIVRQSDAHAWTEVWTGDGGWKRVDPTAVVSPVRVESGIGRAMPAGEPLPFMARARGEWLLQLRYNWDALANQWNQWVLGYNPERQREVLTRLGMDSPSWESLAIALFWTLAGVIGLLALWLLRRIRLEDPALRLWQSFCVKLGRAGLMRASSEGPLDYAERAASRFPRRAGAVRAIGALYADLRYGAGANSMQLSRLRRLVREFKV